MPQGLAQRLAIQIDALQEAFELLSRAGTLREMGRRLFQLLRGVLTVVDARILYRPAGGSWEPLHGSAEGITHLLPDDTSGTGCRLETLRADVLRLRAVQPLLDDSVVAVLLGRKLSRRSPYTDLDRLILQVYLQLFASAYQAFRARKREKDLLFNLQHRLLQLTTLIDSGLDLARPRPEEELYALALERAVALTNASRGAVRTGTQGTLQTRMVFPPGAALRRNLPEGNRLSASFEFQGTTSVFELQEKESRIGIQTFDETDGILLEALSRQVHAALEVRQLHALEADKLRIEREISVAGAIQKRILPENLPAIPGYDVAGVNIPTRMVGGDYYDCVPLTGGRYALVMADVAGKGMPAALLVSSFHAYLSAFLERNVPLDELATLLNAAMYRDSTEERYITAIIALFDPASGHLECINAGHTSLYHLRAGGGVEAHDPGGLALGLFEEALPLDGTRLELAPGDRLLLYTDGVTEAMNTDRRMYDEADRLRTFSNSFRPDRAQEFIEGLLTDIRTFVSDAPQADDITAMYLLRR